MSKIIACVNQKGGVGKTTTAVNLAAGLRRLTGANVLFIDIDTQANGTSTLLGDGFAQGNLPDDEFCIYDVLINDDIQFVDALYEAELAPNAKGEVLTLDILPSNVILSSAEIDLVSTFRREYRLADKFDAFVKAA
ncbi:MAG: AAA family ATPase, partial [Chloroflexota bacterium]